MQSLEVKLATCPACNKQTLKSEAGCHECIDCGYGVCG